MWIIHIGGTAHFSYLHHEVLLDKLPLCRGYREDLFVIGFWAQNDVSPTTESLFEPQSCFFLLSLLSALVWPESCLELFWHWNSKISSSQHLVTLVQRKGSLVFYLMTLQSKCCLFRLSLNLLCLFWRVDWHLLTTANEKPEPILVLQGHPSIDYFNIFLIYSPCLLQPVFVWLFCQGLLALFISVLLW